MTAVREGRRPPADQVESGFSVVRIRDVSRHYGRRRALARVTLDCHAGRIVGLFGPNGSGKSTLIGVLATLLRPTTGEVRYGDRTAAEWGDALRRHIGVLGHDLFLYSDLTARENLEFFGQLHGIVDVPGAVQAALDSARLTERADDRAGRFSRGLRQRLALERALLHRPQLVLLDEPFTGLDDTSAGFLLDRIRALRTSGTIVVMATHDFEFADDVIDDAVCLHDGKVIPMGQDGPLRQRYRRAVLEAQR